MKIQLLSDLHLEVDPDFCPQPAPLAEVLVLAGDIGAAPDSPMGAHGRADWCLARFSPRLGNWPVPVLYVPGNHEFDGQDFDETRVRLRATCSELGIQWLDEASWHHGNVRFLGTTLWTDFDVLANRPAHMPGSMTHNLREREKAFKAVNFHLQRALIQRGGELFDSAAMREEGLRCQQWLAAQLAVPHGGPTVVVTHFAPSLQSQDPRYGAIPSTAGFCSSLEHLMAGVDLWVHGHLHSRSDYWIDQCHVVANPLGYADKDEQLTFDAACVIEIG